MYLRIIGRHFTQMVAYFLVMNSKRCIRTARFRYSSAPQRCENLQTLIWSTIQTPGKFRDFEVTYQAWDAVLHHEMKHREDSWTGELIRRAAEYFWRTSRCFIWWRNTVSNLSNGWYYFSNEMTLEEEIKEAKMSSFSSDFHTLTKH